MKYNKSWQCMVLLICAYILSCSYGINIRRNSLKTNNNNNNLLNNNNNNIGEMKTAPKPQYVCPAMDMLHLRKIGPSPKMLRDGTTFNPDERDKNIVQNEIVNTGNLFTQYTGQRAHTFPTTPYPSINVFPSMKERIPYKPASKHFFSCPDPRTPYAGMFTPGGDLGEFLLVLTAMENLQKEEKIRYGQQEVTFLLHDYLEYMSSHGKFEFASCTDEQALSKLTDTAKVGNAMDPMNRVEFARILTLSSMPEHIGSRFLADIVKDSNGYGTRSRLVQHLIKAFVRIALDKADPMNPRIRYVTLQGKYQPDSYVEIVRMECPRKKEDGERRFEICTVYPCHDLVPLVVLNDGVKPTGKVPAGTVDDVVALHRDDVKLFRAELAEWGFGRLKTTKDEPPKIDAAKLLQEMLKIGDMQLERFKNKFFSTLGQYEAMYLSNEKFIEKPNPKIDPINPNAAKEDKPSSDDDIEAKEKPGSDENGKF